MNREDAIKQAIDDIKNSDYHGSAVKVELEAQLNRARYSRPPTPNNIQRQVCTNADCSDGEVYDDGLEEYIDCETCGSTGFMPQIIEGSHDWQNTTYCKNWLDAHVSPEAREALIYGRFYYDGSVDSEYTFTMPIEHPEYCVEYIKAWADMAREINQGMETGGAGMHIAILNDPSGRYPTGNRLDSRKARNFEYTMNRLMPALFFLASPDHKSRPLRYRMPMVGLNDKYTAISGHKGVFEYRVFETCYEKPEAFFDMFCVIANSLKFYKDQVVELPFFGKIGRLGFKDGEGLDRFFFTSKHIEALTYGIEVLKPSYKTFDQLKKERGIDKTLSNIVSQEKKKEKQWEIGYKEYVEISEHQNRSAINRLKASYKDMCKTEGVEWTKRNYGTELNYIKMYQRSVKVMTVQEYVANCKESFYNKDVRTVVTV